MEMPIKNFAALSQTILCFFVSVILFFIHKREKLKSEKYLEYVVEYDRGVFWISAAISIWTLAGILTLCIPFNQKIDNTSLLLELVRIILSTINSVCFIIAVAYFDYGPSWLKLIQQDEKLRKPLLLIVIVISILLFVLTYIFLNILFPHIFTNPRKSFNHVIDIIDVFLALFTLYVLYVGITSSFKQRHFKEILFLAKLTFLLVLFAQLLDCDLLRENLINWLNLSASNNYINIAHWLILLNSKILFIVIILAQIIGWKIEEEEDLYTGEPRLKFLGRKDYKEWEVIIIIPKLKAKKVKISLTDATHRHLLWFAYYRKYNIKDEGYIYLLENKSHDGRPSFKNQLDRIMEKIFESYVTKKMTLQEREILKSDIFKEMFNQGTKSYQLKLAPQNIRLYSKKYLIEISEFDEDINYLVNKIPDIA